MSQEARLRMKKIADLSASIFGSLQYLQQEQETFDRTTANITAEQKRVDEKTQQLRALVNEPEQESEQ